MSHEQALAPLDAAFLHVESERTPMHMASVGIFEGGPLYDVDGKFRIDDIRKLVASRLKFVPKLRQIAFAGLLNEAPPVWADDPYFDISEHVRVCRLRSPGSDAQLRRLCAKVLAVPLDRTRPLWELMFVEGLAAGRVAVIEKLHHSMADGLAAAELATVLLDLSPRPEMPGDVPPWIPDAPPPAWKSAIDDLRRLGEVWMRTMAWGGQSLIHPIRGLKSVAMVGQGISTLATPRIIAPRSSLNTPITAARSVEFVRLPFNEVQDVAHANDATINDVLLAIVAGGLHRLLESRGELTATSELQVLVPVGITDARAGLTNSVSALFVRLPVGVNDPVEVLRKVSVEVRSSKRRHQSLATVAILHLLEPLPQGILATAAGIVQHQPFFNLIVTNVPGPPVPLYALGARLLEAFPIVPLAGNQSLGVAALSYEGQINLGVLSDPVTCPDVALFCEGVQSSLRTLVEQPHAAASHT